VKTWKAILAALVIFLTGAVTGGVVAWQTGLLAKLSPPKPPSPSYWFIHRPDFTERMKRELNLTVDQVKRIETAIRESRQRTDLLWLALSEPMQGEMNQIKKDIRDNLTAEQRVKFDELLKPKPWSGKPFDHSRRRPGSNDDKPKFPGPGGFQKPGERPPPPPQPPPQ